MSPRPKQLDFFAFPTRSEHGGSLLKGRRKRFRPIDPKTPLHVVLKSNRARGEWSMLHGRHGARVRTITSTTARRFGVTIYGYANVGNHLHLLVQGQRTLIQSFLRVVAGAISFLITGTRKGKKLAIPYWSERAYSRIVAWGKDFIGMRRYLAKNLIEAAGIPRERFHWIGRNGRVIFSEESPVQEARPGAGNSRKKGVISP